MRDRLTGANPLDGCRQQPVDVARQGLDGGAYESGCFH
jgi:hypothetical protein